MPAKDRGREGVLSSADVLKIQLEANEQLLLAALLASEQVDDAQQEVRALQADERELRTVAELRERLIGIIGHDLRTPISTILMASGMLLARGNLHEADAELAARIVSSAQRMSRMIGQLADFTRARLGGGFVLNVTSVDLAEICRDVTEELRITSPVALSQSARGDVRGLWDPDRLAQALSNIASNAVDHAAPATPVRIEARDEGDWVAVDVTNTGECIAPELLPVIFAAFGRAMASAGERGGHLGLGLYVASEIARAHGGTIRVRSSEGTTTFSMRLPRGATRGDAKESPREPAPGTRPQGRS